LKYLDLEEIFEKLWIQKLEGLIGSLKKSIILKYKPSWKFDYKEESGDSQI
jgi:hypothetical protein